MIPLPPMPDVQMDELHKSGDADCAHCYAEYPLPHACGGLMHCEFIDESYDEVFLRKRCDGCGEEE